jgi:hypothetical protein
MRGGGEEVEEGGEGGVLNKALIVKTKLGRAGRAR